MELLSLPKETIVDILLLLPPKSLIKFLSINRNLQFEVLTDPRLSQIYQRSREIIQKRNTILANFFPITLNYLHIIKDNISYLWNNLLKFKNYQDYLFINTITNRRTLIPLTGIIVIFYYSFDEYKYYDYVIKNLEGETLHIDLFSEKLFSHPLTFGPFNIPEELKESQIRCIFTDRYEAIWIYLNRAQINSITNNMLDYI
jgi:hypothetical protein